MSSILNWIAHDEEEEEKIIRWELQHFIKGYASILSFIFFLCNAHFVHKWTIILICHTEVFANLNDNDLGLNFAFCAFYRNSVTES